MNPRAVRQRLARRRDAERPAPLYNKNKPERGQKSQKRRSAKTLSGVLAGKVKKAVKPRLKDLPKLAWQFWRTKNSIEKNTHRLRPECTEAKH